MLWPEVILIQYMKIINPKKSKDNVQHKEVLPNLTQAVKQLKSAQKLLEIKKKQIKVMSIKAQRGNHDEKEFQIRERFYKSIRQDSQQIEYQLSLMKAKQIQRVNQLRNRSEKVRQQGFRKRSLSKIQAIQHKIRINHEVRQKSNEHSQKILKLKDQLLKNNINRCRDLYGSRQQSRSNYEKMKVSRISQMRINQSRERDQLLQKLRQRQQQLAQLDKIQTSTSRIDYSREPSTSDNIKSLDESLRIYNPNFNRRGGRKKILSEPKMLKKDSKSLLDCFKKDY